MDVSANTFSDTLQLANGRRVDNGHLFNTSASVSERKAPNLLHRRDIFPREWAGITKEGENEKADGVGERKQRQESKANEREGERV